MGHQAIAMFIGVLIGAIATLTATLVAPGRVGVQRVMFILLAVGALALSLFIATGAGAIVLNSNTTLLLMILAAQLLVIAKLS